VSCRFQSSCFPVTAEELYIERILYDPVLVPASEPVEITVQSRFAAAWKQYFEVSSAGATLQTNWVSKVR